MITVDKAGEEAKKKGARKELERTALKLGEICGANQNQVRNILDEIKENGYGSEIQYAVTTSPISTHLLLAEPNQVHLGWDPC